MNEKSSLRMKWAVRAVPGTIVLVLALMGTGVAVEPAHGASSPAGVELEGVQLAAVLGVPIGPRLGIVPQHEVGRGDTHVTAVPAEVAPVATEQIAAMMHKPEPVQVAAAATTTDPSGIDSLRNHFPVAVDEPETADDVPSAAPAAKKAAKPGLLASFFHRKRDDSQQLAAAVTEAEPERAAPAAKTRTLAIPSETVTAPTPEPVPVSVPEVEPAPAPALAPVQVVREPAPVHLAMNQISQDVVPARAVAPKPAPVQLAQVAVHGELPLPGRMAAGHRPLEGKTVHANPPSVKIAARGPGRRSRPNLMRVLAGKSLLIDLKSDAKRVSVANPEVAEVLVVTPRQIMINGLAEGETSIIIWDRSGNYTMNSLVVGNTLQDQVMLEVTVAEINRTAMEQHGVDIRAFNGAWGGLSNLGNVAPVSGQYPPGQGDPLFPLSLDGGISWAVVNVKEDIAILFKQLQDENLARVLAEPKLLARSGQEANFLSGGEIPIVITQNQDTTIEFKEFGTSIRFVPRVREDGMIDLEIESEVSEPDFAAGVELFGFNVPAFITRRVETDVSLHDGESLIIAGLIKETKQEIESKMPFMGDIPFLGYFFRATEYKNEIKELVMVVRPRLVVPIERGDRIALPTDRGPLTRDEVKTQETDAKVSRPRPW
ncbi:MAG: pilus assembly protein N-terminal domain-containing protein [Candidatus Binatia bacterium]